MAHFKYIFIVSTKGGFDQSYALSGADSEVKDKFKGLLSKVWDWKANFVIVWRLVPYNPSDDTLPV